MTGLDLDTFAEAIITSGGCWDLNDLIELAAEAAHKLASAGVAFSVDDDWIDICASTCWPRPCSCELAKLIDRRIGAEQRQARTDQMERLRKAAWR